MSSAVGSTTTLPKTSNTTSPAIQQAPASNLQQIFQEVSSEQYNTLKYCKQLTGEQPKTACNVLAVVAGMMASEDLLLMTAADYPIEQIRHRAEIHNSTLEKIRTCEPGNQEKIREVVTRMRDQISAARSSTKPAGRDKGGVFTSRD